MNAPVSSGDTVSTRTPIVSKMPTVLLEPNVNSERCVVASITWPAIRPPATRPKSIPVAVPSAGTTTGVPDVVEHLVQVTPLYCCVK